MNKALAVFRRDLKRILCNPVAIAIALGICVVPCLYAWINVLANWDPYENTSDVPVAVVNNDHTVDLESIGKICVGDMMVEALEENDKIGWQFLDEDVALENVRTGTCYAAIVIPDDFTKNLTDILDGNINKAHLKYYVNEKVNPIAPKVTDTGASTVERQIDSKFAAKVGEVIAEKLGDASDKLIGDSQKALGDENAALDNVYLSLVDASNQFGSLADHIRSAKDSLDDAADDLSSLQGIGGRVGSKLTDVLNKVNDTRSNANNTVRDINSALDKGSSNINSLAAEATRDVSAITGDVSQALSEVNAAIRALENDLTDNQAMTSKISGARDLMININPTFDGGADIKVNLQNELDHDLDFMVQLTDSQSAKLDELRSIAQRLQSAANEVSGLANTINDRAESATSALRDVQTGTVSDILFDVNSALDTFTQTGNELSATAKSVDPMIEQTVSLTRQLADVFDGAGDALGGTKGSIDELATFVDSVNDQLAAIRASEAWSVIKDATKTNPEGVSDFLSAPVEIEEVALFPVENYASGVAPFFTSLALWVGGIALIAIFKLEVDEDEVGKLRPWQAYFGRWLFFVLLAIVQAVVCCTGDLIIGIQCAHPWAFYLSAIVASFAFINVIYGLSVAFKHLGKALAFTLIILQVPGSSGMYPIEMMPPFFQTIGPWLPFTYSNNAMREAIGGLYEANLIYNIAMLLLFVAPSILLGVTARSHLVNVNALFDRRLRETDHLMVSEPTVIEGNHYRLATVVKAMRSPKEYREEFEKRSAAFEKAYPRLVRGGMLALVLLPLGIFLLMLVLDAQLPTIACFVVALVVIYSALILIEYFHDRIQHKRDLTELPEEELEGILRDTLREEFLAYAPVDAIIERRKARKDKATADEATADDAAEGNASEDDAPKGGDE